MQDPFPFSDAMTDQMLEWVRSRIATGPDPKHGAQSPQVLDAAMGGTITKKRYRRKTCF